MLTCLANCGELLREHAISTVYLFGSRASGLAHAHSDYDLALLFTDYDAARLSLTYRLSLAETLSQCLGESVDLVFLQAAPILMRYEIVATGKVIYCNNDAQRTDFEDITYRDYLDFNPFLVQYYREEAEAIRSGFFFKQDLSK